MATIAREVYPSGKTFQYIGRDSYAFGPVLADVALPAIIFPELVILAATTVVTTADIKVQVSRSSASQVAAGVAHWEDLNAGSGGTGTDLVETYNPVIAVRMFAIDSHLATDLAELYVIASPAENVANGFQAQTPDGGICTMRKNNTGGVTAKGQRVRPSATLADCVDIGPTGDTEFGGIMYSAGMPDGGWCLVVVEGDALALITNATPVAMGTIMVSSATVAGRSDPAAVPAPYTGPTLAGKWGYPLEANAGGVNQLVLCHIGK